MVTIGSTGTSVTIVTMLEIDMPTILEPPLERVVTQINGVSLLTTEGKRRARYSDKERLQILGATPEELDATLDLFAPRRPFYAITRSGSNDPRDWTTARGRLRDTDVLKHLLGDLIPSQSPRWVAPKAWEATQWVGIDVDYRGDREDFRARCRRVQKALYVLGVPRAAWLVSRTPSGGRHYRFFVSRHIRTDSIPDVLASVGLRETSGQIEIFPKLKKGMRLPFGCIPGRRHDPSRWLTFIRAWIAGEIPRVNWLRCLRRAERHAERELQKQLDSDEATEPLAVQEPPKRQPSCVSEPRRSVTLGIPRWKRQAAAFTNADTDRKRYLEILGRSCWSRSDAEELWNLGIQMEGTRVEATKRLAWHLIRVRRLPKDIAAEQLCGWVYDTGRTTSKDVQADIREGTRKVEKQTLELVEYCSALPTTVAPRAAFSTEELDAIVGRVKESDAECRQEQVEFALHFLEYAKKHGRMQTDGWECQVAVRGIMRNWPKCSGTRYKPKLDALLDCGLVEMTREKRQTNNRTGRPRTYLIRVPIGRALAHTLTFTDALAHARRQLIPTSVCSASTGRESEQSDTYGRIIPPLPPETKGEVYEVAAQGNAGIESGGLESASTSSDGRLAVTAHPVYVSQLSATAPGRLSGTLCGVTCVWLAAAGTAREPSASPLNDCRDKSPRNIRMSLTDFQRLEAARLDTRVQTGLASCQSLVSGLVPRLVDHRISDRTVLSKRQCQGTGQQIREFGPKYPNDGNNRIRPPDGSRDKIPDTS